MAAQVRPSKTSWTMRIFWHDLHTWKHLRTYVDHDTYLEKLYQLLNKNKFNSRLYVVTSLGFLASSYSLFATSILWPAVSFVYREDYSLTTHPGLVFDLVTLGGIMFGMAFFGHLADRVGRKRLFGLELITIVFATSGIMFASDGYRVPADVKDSFAGRSTMNIFTSITAWRCLLGIGIGAEYPMTAIIAAEYISTDWRPTMIAAVFLWQSIGRMLAFGLGDAFLLGQANYFGIDKYSGPDDYKMKYVVDQTWRFVTGLGAVFAIAAIILRLTIPESPRYYVSIGEDLVEAMTPQPTSVKAAAPTEVGAHQGDGVVANTAATAGTEISAAAPHVTSGSASAGPSHGHHGGQDQMAATAAQPAYPYNQTQHSTTAGTNTAANQQGHTQPSNTTPNSSSDTVTTGLPTSGTAPPPADPASLEAGMPPPPVVPKWFVGATRYLRMETGRRVFTMCVLWFALDVCFYGTGLDSPPALNVLWLTSPPNSTVPSPLVPTNGTGGNVTANGSTNYTGPAYWEIDPYNATLSIFEILYNDGTRSLEVYSISSLLGSLAVLPLLSCVRRRLLLLCTCAALSAVFLITGALVLTQYAKPTSVVIRVFYALAQFLFNLGPNTIIFVMAVEVFPTVVRGTCFGLAAMSGKAAAMLVRPAVSWASAAGQANNPGPLAALNFAFAAIMLLIALAVAPMPWPNETLRLGQWFEFPELQEERKPGHLWLKNLDLEVIAPNPGPGELILEDKASRRKGGGGGGVPEAAQNQQENQGQQGQQGQAAPPPPPPPPPPAYGLHGPGPWIPLKDLT